jgi:hypothetical protein
MAWACVRLCFRSKADSNDLKVYAAGDGLVPPAAGRYLGGDGMIIFSISAVQAWLTVREHVLSETT